LPYFVKYDILMPDEVEERALEGDSSYLCLRHGEVRNVLEYFLLSLSVNILSGLAVYAIVRFVESKVKGHSHRK